MINIVINIKTYCNRKIGETPKYRVITKLLEVFILPDLSLNYLILFDY